MSASLTNSFLKQSIHQRFWRAIDCTGPYAPFIALYALGLPLLLISRIALVIWQFDQFSIENLITVIIQGIRVDFILLGLVSLIPLLILPIVALFKKWTFWKRFSYAWIVAAAVIMVFLELITPTFIMEYGNRPNTLLIEYLQYPKEVASMIWQGFRGTLFAVLISAGLFILGLLKLAAPWKNTEIRFKGLVFWVTYPLILLLVLITIRSSFGHRPANPAMFTISNNPIVNTLVLNSSYSAIYAAYSMKHEKNSSQVYGKLEDGEVVKGIKTLLSQQGNQATLVGGDEYPSLRKHMATRQREKPLNIVIILEESLGAGFVKSLGGASITPELDALQNDGWWFENLYATGTRSVRGIEAVVAGFAPTPARSVVKRTKAQKDFCTIASILAKKGYSTEFIYGGEAHFDNMRGFFIGNGFQHIVEEKDFVNPSFASSWGVSDEDLFIRTHEELLKHHASGKPFFDLVFTSSNHAPFEFPDGKIDYVDQNEKATEHNAVRYASYALGKFFELAKASPYYKDTLFLVVADHDIRVRGDQLIPVKHFHIPGVILGADLEPKKIKTITSQIDLAPTLLSLAGIDSINPMIGRDMSADPEHIKGRAMMQYNDHFGWMENNELTILRPEKPAAFGIYDASAQTLTPTAPPADADERTAKAILFSTIPEWLYQNRRYPME